VSTPGPLPLRWVQLAGEIDLLLGTPEFHEQGTQQRMLRTLAAASLGLELAHELLSYADSEDAEP